MRVGIKCIFSTIDTLAFSWRAHMKSIWYKCYWEIEMVLKIFPNGVSVILFCTQMAHNSIFLFAFWIYFWLLLFFFFQWQKNSTYGNITQCFIVGVAVAERISSLSLRQTERAFIFLDDIRNEASRAPQQPTKKENSNRK